jgi:5-methylcytosine-specific restriction endonuclease McrA
VKNELLTLKLDASWRPIDIVNSYRGFNMIFAGRARSIRDYDFSVNSDHNFPAVIVLNSYISHRQMHLSCTRRNVFWRDNNLCQYCGKEFKQSDLSMDHVVPKSLGGEKKWSNIVTACKRCNGKKSNQTLKESGMVLLRPPVEPKASLLDFYRNITPPELWIPFLF